VSLFCLICSHWSWALLDLVLVQPRTEVLIRLRTQKLHVAWYAPLVRNTEHPVNGPIYLCLRWSWRRDDMHSAMSCFLLIFNYWHLHFAVHVGTRVQKHLGMLVVCFFTTWRCAHLTKLCASFLHSLFKSTSVASITFSFPIIWPLLPVPLRKPMSKDCSTCKFGMCVVLNDSKSTMLGASPLRPWYSIHDTQSMCSDLYYDPHTDSCLHSSIHICDYIHCILTVSCDSIQSLHLCVSNVVLEVACLTTHVNHALHYFPCY